MEQTSTLVLSSRRSYFVDIRVLLSVREVKSNGPFIPHHETTFGPLPLNRLDWAFAGQSDRVPYDALQATTQSNAPFARGKWHHWADSRYLSPETDVQDEGDLLQGQEDDLGLEIERGSMINPDTGRLEDYEEAWQDLEVEKSENISVLRANQYAEDPDEKILPSQPRGMIIRVGTFCQGVLRIGHSVSVERCRLDAEAGAWNDLLHIGPRRLDCASLLKNGVPGPTGGQVFFQHAGLLWECLEYASSR